MELCTARTGTYPCWRQANHLGEHRSFFRTPQRTGYLAWTDPYNVTTRITKH